MPDEIDTYLDEKPVPAQPPGKDGIDAFLDGEAQEIDAFLDAPDKEERLDTVREAVAAGAKAILGPVQSGADALAKAAEHAAKVGQQTNIPGAEVVNKTIDALQSKIVEEPQKALAQLPLPEPAKEALSQVITANTAAVALAGEFLKLPETVNEALMAAAAGVTLSAAARLLPKAFPKQLPTFAKMTGAAEAAIPDQPPGFKEFPTAQPPIVVGSAKSLSLQQFHIERKRILDRINHETQALKNFRAQHSGNETRGVIREIGNREQGLGRLRAKLAQVNESLKIKDDAGMTTYVPMEEPAAVAAEAIAKSVPRRSPAPVPHAPSGAGATSGPLTAPRSIVAELQEKLNVPIRRGLFREHAYGITKVASEVIRIGTGKKSGDLETVFHEAGHILNKRIFNPGGKGRKLSTDAFKPYLDELGPIATEADKPLSEGFAEFVRLYVANEPEAKRVAPRFYQFFEGKLGQHPEAHEALLKARQDFDRLMKAPAAARILAQISKGERGLPSAAQIRDTFKSLYTGLVDDLAPLTRAVEGLAGKDKLPVAQDPGKLAQLYRGWFGKAESFLKYRTLDFKTLGWKNKALKEILAPVEARLDDFRVYLVSRRAQELNARSIQSGIIPTDAETAIKELGGPEFQQAFDALQQWNDDLLRYLVDAGVMDSETYLGIKELNRNYVPFYRVTEDPAAAASGMGKRFANLFNPVKRIKGSHLDIVDPLESLVKNAYAYISIAERNRVARALADMAKLEGAGKFIEEVPAPIKGMKVGLEELKSQLGELGIAVDGEMADKLLSIFRPGQFSPAKGIISVRYDGKPKYYQLADDLFESVMKMDVESLGLMGRILAFPASTLRAGATLSPEFVARNPLRDQFSAFIFSRNGYKPPLDFPRGLFHVLNADELYWKWKVAGGENATLVSMDRTYLKKTLDQVMRESGVPVAELIRHPVKAAQALARFVPNVVRHPIETLRALSSISEETTRVGEFLRSLKAREAEGLDPRAAMEAAGLDSREATLDFARAGAKGRALNQIIAFWNAQVQGLDKLVRSGRERPGATSLRILAAVTIPELLLYMASKDDPRMDEVPAWQKDLFYVIPTGKMTRQQWAGMSAEERQQFNAEHPIWRIPGPFEMKVLFGAMPRRILDYIRTQDQVAFEKTAETLFESMAVGVIPTAVQPIVENFANWSVFFGRPIVPRQSEELDPFLQGGPRTSQLASKIGEALGYSPAKIDHLIYGYTGGLGVYGVKAVDALLREAGIADPVPEVEPTKADKALVRAFAVRFPSANAASIDRFYRNLFEVRAKANTYQEMVKTRDKRVGDYYKKHQSLIVKSRAMEAMADNFKLMRKVVQGIFQDAAQGPAEKRKAIDATYFLMIEMAQRANKALGITAPPASKAAAPPDQEALVINQILAGDQSITGADAAAIMATLQEEADEEAESE